MTTTTRTKGDGRVASLSRQSRFIVGAAIGLVLAGIVLALFATTYASSPFASAVLSGMTFLGLGVSAVGYLIHRGNYSSSGLFDFVFGFGVGVMIVAFFGTINGGPTFPF